MARGKAFRTSLKQLVSAGVIPKPVWMPIVDATRPPFQPVTVTRSPPIEYPEDRLRSIFLQRNPYARRMPVNMKAKFVSDRHIADRFVSKQMALMEQDNLTEEEAYDVANRILKAELRNPVDIGTNDLHGSISDPTIENEAARLYLASLRDSTKDKALYQALSRQSGERR